MYNRQLYAVTDIGHWTLDIRPSLVFFTGRLLWQPACIKFTQWPKISIFAPVGTTMR